MPRPRTGRVGVVAVMVVVALLAGPAVTRAATAGADPAPTPPPTAPPDPTAPVDPAAPPAAPAPPPEPLLPDPSPQIRVALARLRVIDTDRNVALLSLAVTGAQQAEAEGAAAVAVADQGVAAAHDALEVRRSQLGTLASVAFMRAGGGTMGSLLQDDPTFATRQQGMFDASLEHLDGQVSDAQTVVDAAEATRADAEQVAADRTAARTAADAALAAGQADGVAAASELATATANAARPPSAHPWQLMIEGPSAFTADELRAWYLAQGHGSQASVPIDELIGNFIDEGAAEGVQGDMAFAQAIHETGWFANSDTVGRNNYAGIGHCEACGGGFPFPTAQMGVRAQVQLLKSYAEKDPTYNSPRADPNLSGPAGCCPAWFDLGGVWASAPNYGPHILGGYLDMLDWLITYRPTEPLISPDIPSVDVAKSVASAFTIGG